MRTKFLLSVVGRTVPLTVAFIYSFFAPTQETRVAMFVGSLLLLITAEYFGIYRPLQNIEETRKKQLDLVFKKWIESVQIGDTKPKLRINVMLVKWSWVGCFFGRKFYQYYQLNMEGDPDADMSFSIRQGFCGLVFRERAQKAKYRDFRKMSAEEQLQQFGWSGKMFTKTQHIKAIACAALYKDGTSFFRGHIKPRYFGVINVDAMDDSGADYLADRDVLDQVTYLAKVAQVTFPD